MRDAVVRMIRDWSRQRKPTREDYLKGAQTLETARLASGTGGLWPTPPLMLTATLDDGWGHGLDVIEALAQAVGVRVRRLGLLQTPADVAAACRKRQPNLLGLTVLQFDTDDALKRITADLPPSTTLVAGGAAYRYDPDFAGRTGTHAVAQDGMGFLKFLLDYQPMDSTTGSPNA
jgi:methylmalonyl-CoA mutase cobalamin-binding subunit